MKSDEIGLGLVVIGGIGLWLWNKGKTETVLGSPEPPIVKPVNTSSTAAAKAAAEAEAARTGGMLTWSAAKGWYATPKKYYTEGDLESPGTPYYTVAGVGGSYIGEEPGTGVIGGIPYKNYTEYGFWYGLIGPDI